MSRRRRKGTYATRRRNQRRGKNKMRKLTLTAHQFNSFVYPNVAHDNAKGDGDWETALRVIQHLKDPEKTKEAAMTADEVKAKQEGRPVYPNYRLLDDEAEFLFQDDEWRMVRDKVKAGRDTCLITAAVDFEELLQVIENAEKVEVKEVEPEPEPEDPEEPEL